MKIAANCSIAFGIILLLISFLALGSGVHDLGELMASGGCAIWSGSNLKKLVAERQARRQ